jgi:cytochrome b561
MQEARMEPPFAPARYSRSARWFHWLAFAFVALAYLLINLRNILTHGSDARTLAMQGHMLAGLVVLALVLPRLLHRLRNAPPPITPAPARWETLLSRTTHLALYAFLLVQPLLGLLTAFSAGHGLVVPWTGLQIPSPLTANKELSEQLGNIHGWIGTIFYYVIGLHIVGALWHHFVRRDDTLRRMT